MSFIVTSESSPTILLDSSSQQKEAISTTSDNSVVINNNNLLLGHYSTSISYLEEDEVKLPALYHHQNNPKIHPIEGGSAVEEEDTEDEEDDDEDLLSSSINVSALGENQEPSSILIEEEKTPPPAATSVPIKTTSKSASAAALVIKKEPLSSSFSHSLLPPIQTYSPQSNLSLYSPSITPTPISSIRSSSNKKSRAYNSSSSPSAPCLLDTSSTVQNPTSSFMNKLQQKPLYSSTSPSSIFSTIKMDIRSPPQPLQSTSCFMNALNRFRGSSTNHQKHHHQNTNNNSVAPAEIITIKSSPSKSSLADKIKIKFHQQLDKKKNRASLVESTNRKNSISNKKKSTSSSTTERTSFSMPRSASLSSITNWSRLNKTSVVPAMPTTNRKSLISVTKQQQEKMTHSTSVTSFRSSTSTSSSRSSSSYGVATRRNVTPAPPAPFALTKSISSHRLYKNINSTTSDSRPRQPLRAINPNDSIRLSSSSRQKTVQQQQKKKPAVRFTKLVCVRETFSKSDYDRGSDPEAVCTRLTPALAQHIKEELNAYKLHEMQVHEYSRVHTHFFL